MIDEEVGQFGRREADETDARALRARLIGPRRLAAMVDERRKDESDVALERCTIAAAVKSSPALSPVPTAVAPRFSS